MLLSTIHSCRKMLAESDSGGWHVRNGHKKQTLFSSVQVALLSQGHSPFPLLRWQLGSKTLGRETFFGQTHYINSVVHNPNNCFGTNGYIWWFKCQKNWILLRSKIICFINAIINSCYWIQFASLCTLFLYAYSI